MSTLAAKLLSASPNTSVLRLARNQTLLDRRFPNFFRCQRSGKRYPGKIVHVSPAFLTVLLRAPAVPKPSRRRVFRASARDAWSAGQWTFVPPLPIMKKINHLGETNRVPLELKSTINLPKTDFPMKANLPQNEPKALARWEEMGIYERIREARQGAPSLCPARRTALRQRAHPPGPRAEQVPQGFRRQVQDHGRI